MSQKPANIHDLFSCNRFGFALSNALWQPLVYVGPEIETESWIFHNISYLGLQEKLKYWYITEDGSLRKQGKELKAKFPLAGKDIISALKELAFITNETGKVQTHSVRTSNHYHINVSDLNVLEVSNILLWSAYFESTLFELGRIKYHRKNNPYCQSVLEQTSFSKIIQEYIEKDYNNAVITFSNKIPKYCSFHLNSGFGTIEYRVFDSTLSPIKNLLWINILSEFIINAKSIHFGKNLYQDPHELAKKIWGKGYNYIKKWVPKKISPIFTEFFCGSFLLDNTKVDMGHYAKLYEKTFNLKSGSPIKRKSTGFLSGQIPAAQASTSAGHSTFEEIFYEFLAPPTPQEANP